MLNRDAVFILTNIICRRNEKYELPEICEYKSIRANPSEIYDYLRYPSLHIVKGVEDMLSFKFSFESIKLSVFYIILHYKVNNIYE